MNLSLRGKSVIITGGTKGIGSGIARVFAEEGANLVLNYRSDPEGSETFVRKIRDEYGIKAYGIMADISKKEDVLRIFDMTEDKLGYLDILINNAGSGTTTPLLQISLEEWQEALDNNVTSMFLMSQEYAKRMIAGGRKGYIVNLLSKASMTTTTKGRACYVTNKTAEMGLTKQLAVDLIDYGIIVNGIMPGTVMNRIMESMTDDQRGERLKRCPTGRFGQPEEIGKMVAFLASEQNQLTVGVPVDCSGGMLLGF